MTAPLLQVENVSKRFGGFVALDGVTSRRSHAANGSA